ncbi:hypothetical protein ACYULU_01350 [Breznakiellaceae bacterium SP9]
MSSLGNGKCGVEKRRYVRIDPGKQTYELAIIGRKGKVSLSNGTTDIEERYALYKKLETTDKIAIEAGTMSFIIAKIQSPCSR